MSNDKEILEHYDFVTTQYRKLYEELVKESCNYLPGCHEEQGVKRWLLCGRIISLLFSSHFRLSIQKSSEELSRVENEGAL